MVSILSRYVKLRTSKLIVLGVQLWRFLLAQWPELGQHANILAKVHLIVVTLLENRRSIQSYKLEKWSQLATTHYNVEFKHN